KGAAAMVSGTMAAAVPIDVPTIKRVNGMMATSRMMKGVDLTALTTMPRPRFRLSTGSTPLRSVRCSRMPMGTPTSEPTRPEMPTITSVSTNDLINRSISCDDMIHFLYRYPARAHIGFRLFHFFFIAPGQYGQRAEGLLLDFIDLAVQYVEVQPEAAHHLGQQRLFHARAGECQAQKVVPAFAFARLRKSCAHALEHALGQLL